MNWKILLTAAVVVCSGCTAVSGAETETATSDPGDSRLTEIEQNQTTVYFNGNSFEPRNIAVEQGTTVTWIDNASRSMWVASDDHPRHTKYSGTSVTEHCRNGDQQTAAFDQCGTGDRFSFTFEKPGSWEYHNHQPYVQGGTVNVE